MAIKINKDIEISDSTISLDDLIPKTSTATSNTNTYSCSYINDLNQKHIIQCGLTSEITCVLSTYTIITSWRQTYNIGSKLSMSGGRIKIGSGVNHIKVSYDLAIYNNGNAQAFYTYMTKNSTGYYWKTPSIYSYYYGTVHNEGILAVSEGDLISCNYYVGTAAKINNYSTMMIEVID